LSRKKLASCNRNGLFFKIKSYCSEKPVKTGKLFGIP